MHAVELLVVEVGVEVEASPGPNLAVAEACDWEEEARLSLEPLVAAEAAVVHGDFLRRYRPTAAEG